MFLCLVLWYELRKSCKAFCCLFQYQTVEKGNQHGDRGYDDLQNWLDMTSQEIPLYGGLGYGNQGMTSRENPLYTPHISNLRFLMIGSPLRGVYQR